MKVYDIADMHNGWFIGNFEPSVCKSEHFEVAHHKHPAGYETPRHTHKLAMELTYILKGVLDIRGQILKSGQMFLYEPFEIADAKVLEDVELIVVKWPSFPSDKYSVNENGKIIE
jgi:hypothetical protein